MSNRTRLAILLIVLVATVAACTPQELSDFLDVADLRANEDPIHIAAGWAAMVIDEDEIAQDLADEGLREKSPDKLEEAARARPADPRYRAYRFAFVVANGGKEWLEAFHSWGELLRSHRDAELDSRGLEPGDPRAQAVKNEIDSRESFAMLEALDWALFIERGRTPKEPDRIHRLETVFCAFRSRYVARYDPPVYFDLAFVGGTNCEEGS
ncbi:MAG: hypothetical protein PVG83_14475 [Acidimicrobiia bacterium]|jgi:hypothetical protein